MNDQTIPIQFRQSMSLLASSVTVVTTDGGHGRSGLTVSTMCSLSMEPPSIIVCVHRESRALTPLLSNGYFAANVLSDTQSLVAQAFAGQLDEYRNDRFKSGEWERTKTGTLALQGALATFECKLADHKPFGSHFILIGEVLSVADGKGLPLVYADRGFKKLIAA